MQDLDIEEQEPFPVDRDGRKMGSGKDDVDGKVGCCDKFQRSISKWMLPEDLRSKYLERTNCCPPPIFILLVSIGEVRASYR